MQPGTNAGTEHRRKASTRQLSAGVIAALALCVAFPVAVQAAGARKGVQAKPGEIVLLRVVPTRAAVREAPPGLALIVDSKPNSQLDAALDSMELSDREAGAVSAPIRSATSLLRNSMAADGLLAVPGGANGQATPRGAASSTTPLSVVGNATRGVGSTITGALQALPLGKPTGG